MGVDLQRSESYPSTPPLFTSTGDVLSATTPAVDAQVPQMSVHDMDPLERSISTQIQLYPHKATRLHHRLVVLYYCSRMSIPTAGNVLTPSSTRL